MLKKHLNYSAVIYISFQLTVIPNVLIQKFLDCQWSIPTKHDNYFECQDGSFCEGFPHNLSCCNSRGGRAKCPPNRPVMCADTSCAGGKDHCCSRSAQQCYIDASGPRECGMYAEFCIRPQSKILCHHASKR